MLNVLAEQDDDISQGNECRTLLKNLDKLDSMLPAEHYGYLTAFRAFDCVVSSCFSYNLDPNYQRYIDDFERAWHDLGLSVTCKVHLVVEHLAEDVRRFGHGTALLNESAGESVHQDFDSHYSGFIVKDIQSEMYPKRLLKAITTYNANHV